MKRLTLILSLVMYVLLTVTEAPIAHAGSVLPETFNFSGQLLDNTSTPITSGAVLFNVKIYGPSVTPCLLYEEQHTLDLSATNGHFALAVGSGTRTGADPALNMTTVFDNKAVAKSCGAGGPYTPAANDNRKLVVTVDDGTNPLEILAAQDINMVPFAKVADTIRGFEFPTSDGTNGQVLTTNGAGVLSWSTAAGGGGGTVTSVSGSAPLSVTGTTTPVISMTQSSSSVSGYLSSTDWNTFNNKQAAGNYITALTGDVTATGPGSSASTIATGAVTSAKIFDGTIATADLADNAVTSTKVANNAITSAKLFSSAARNQIVATDNITGATLEPLTCSVNEFLTQSAADGWQCTAQNALAITEGQITYTSKTAKHVLAAPSGASGVPTFRQLASSDISGLGTAATQNVGTGANNIVQLDGSGRLPALDGSLLVNLPVGSGISAKTADFSPVAADQGKVFAVQGSSADINVNLPAASANAGLQFQFIRKGSKKVILHGNGGDTINGAGGKVLNSAYATMNIISDGTQWLILNSLGSIINYSLVALGIFDESFSGDGIAVKNSNQSGSSSYDNVYDSAIDSLGRIVVVGSSYVGNPNYDQFMVMRFNSDGTPDSTFDTDGMLFWGSTNSEYNFGVAIDSSNRIITAGTFWNGSTYEINITRINTDGTFDTTFDSDGTLAILPAFFSASGLNWDSGRSVFYDAASGDIFVTGSVNNGTNYDIFVLRLNSDGSADTSFSSDGWLTHDAAGGSSGYEYAYDILVDSSSNVYICGNAYNGSSDVMAVWKFNSSGALDTGYNGTGIFTHDGAAGGSNANDRCYGFTLDSGGKIVAVGTSTNTSPNEDIVTWRINTNGTIDTAFDNDGYAVFNGSTNQYDYGSSIQVDNLGNIVVTGRVYSTTTWDDMVLIRYTSSGALDTTFASPTGYILHNGAAGATNGYDKGVSVHVGDGITVVGTGSNSSNDDVVIWRFQ